jgi:hypothetical protein
VLPKVHLLTINGPKEGRSMLKKQNAPLNAAQAPRCDDARDQRWAAPIMSGVTSGNAIARVDRVNGIEVDVVT